MTIIQDVNHTIRKDELEDIYVLVERSGYIEGFGLKHYLTGDETVLTFDDKEAASKYAERQGWTIKDF